MWAHMAGPTAEPRFERRLTPRGRDDSSLSIAVDHEACILCDRCVRGCDEVKKNHVIGRTGRGYTAGIAFDLNDPMGSSTCVSCGECMVSCPTGALTNKRVIATELGGGEALDAEWILQLPVFKGVSGTFLELNQNAVVKREFKPGDVICREGEFGSTAFYILDGTVDVFIGSSIAHVKQEDAHEGWFAKIRSRLANRQEHTRAEETGKRWIPIDAPVDLPYDNPIAQIGAGRAVRRDDLHELPSALGDRAGEDQGRRARDAAQRARHPAEEQDVPRGARSQVSAARARDASQERAGVRRDARRLHRVPARPRRAGAVFRRAK